jgi:anaerobic dimethyl sulfoxide reductase subunit C (anchor subunit)
VLFTLLSQTAAGLWVMLTLFGAFLEHTARPALLPGLVLAVMLLTSSALVSLKHLGRPSRAWRALANLRTSWLSREIAWVIFTGAVWTIACVLLFFAHPSPGLTGAVMAGGSIAGAVLIFIMVKLYRQRTIPSWDTAHTLQAFFSAALVPGSALAGCMISLNPELSPASRLPVLGEAALLSGLFVLFEILDFAAWQKTLGGPFPATVRKAYIIPLLLAGFFAAGVFLLNLMVSSTSELASTSLLRGGLLLALVVLLVLDALAVRRRLFYQIYQPAGL